MVSSLSSLRELRSSLMFCASSMGVLPRAIVPEIGHVSTLFPCSPHRAPFSTAVPHSVPLCPIQYPVPHSVPHVVGVQPDLRCSASDSVSGESRVQSLWEWSWDLVSVGTEPRSREPNLTADIHLGRRADEVLFIAEIDEEGVGRRVPLPDATVDFLQSHISVQRQGVDRVGAESVCASDGQHSQVS
eukprot:542687-Rhodomonas_salina.1